MENSPKSLKFALIWGLIIPVLVTYAVSRLLGMRQHDLRVTVLELTSPSAPEREGRPLANTEVFVTWSGTRSTDSFQLMHGGTHCIRQEYLRTDSKGMIYIPSWNADWGDHVKEMTIYAHADGFQQTHMQEYREGPIYFAPSEGAVKIHLVRAKEGSQSGYYFSQNMKRCEHDLHGGVFELCGKSVDCVAK